MRIQVLTLSTEMKDMSIDPKTSLQQIDTSIRQGKFQEAIALISKLEGSVRQWKLEDTLNFSHLCRRAGLPLISLKSLRSWLFLDSALRKEAPEAAKVSYAAALINIGANNEAASFFEGISEDQFPEILLHSSFGYFRQWNYKKSVPLLRRYIQHPSISEYQRLVGKVNLIAALIFVGEPTEKLLKNSINIAKKMNASLLHSNLMELQAQSAITQGRTQDAILALEHARQFLTQGSSAYELHLEKWTWFLNAQSQTKNLNQLSIEMKTIQQKAVLLNHRETLRDMDLYWGHFTQNEHYIHKVWFGSPYAHYRNRIEILTGSDLSALQHQTYLWTPQFMDEQDQKVRMDIPLDLSDRNIALSDQGLQILRLLAEDFYRPVRIGELFSQLYPEEHFDPHHSVDRLKKALHRTRKNLQDLGLDLHIQWRKSEIQLIGSSSLRIQASNLHHPTKDRQIYQEEKWAIHLEGKIFSKEHLSLASGYSESTLNRKIKKWLDQKWIVELQDQHQIRKKSYALASLDLRKIPGRFKRPKSNKKAS